MGAFTMSFVIYFFLGKSHQFMIITRKWLLSQIENLQVEINYCTHKKYYLQLKMALLV